MSVLRALETFVPSSVLTLLEATSVPVLLMDMSCLPMDAPAEVSYELTYNNSMSSVEQAVCLIMSRKRQS